MINSGQTLFPVRSGHSATKIGNNNIMVIGGWGSYTSVLSDIWLLSMTSVSTGK